MFTSATWIANVRLALSTGVPLSVTRTVTLKSAGPCASDGTQLNTPVAALIVAPAGAPASSEKLSVLAGTSESVAVAVSWSSAPSLTLWSAIAASSGAAFTSRTWIEIMRLALSAGVPLSATRKVTL